MTKVINIKDKLEKFTETWTPHIIADFDDNMVFVAKIEGDFVWHAHEDQDEMFIVMDGRFRMDFRDGEKWVEKGEMIIVPAGVEHKPFAEKTCSVLVIERADTDHTGGIEDPRRKEEHVRI